MTYLTAQQLIQSDTGTLAKISHLGVLKSASALPVIQTNFYGSSLDTDIWTETNSNGGSVTIADGQASFETNTTANGSIKIISVRNGIFENGQATVFHSGVRGDVGVTDNIRRWGLMTQDELNGMFFEWNGTTFYVVTRKNGVDTQIDSSNFNKDPNWFPTDINIPYRIEYSESKTLFQRTEDDNIKTLHIMINTQTPLVNNLNLALYYENTNINSNTTNVSMFVRGSSTSVFGALPTVLADENITNNSIMKLNKSILTGKGDDGNYKNIGIKTIRGTNNTIQTTIMSPLDVFGRLQVSNLFDLFSAKQLTDNAPVKWDTITSGTGTTSYTSGFPHTNLQVSANGDRVIRQQHGYSIYQPGKSLLILMTGTLITDLSTTNVRARIGYFDDLNDKTMDDNPTGDGFFFQTLNNTVSVVSRSSNDSTIPPTLPPTQTDTIVDQGDWNIDNMDGTGPSGVTIDFSKRQIFVITMEWLGTGDVLMGIYNDIQVLWCHKFNFINGNFGSDPTIAYNCRGSLPARYELEATGIPSTTATMIQVCTSVSSEGGFEPRGLSYTSNPSGTKSISSEQPIVCLRLNQTGTSSIRPRVKLNITHVSFISLSKGNTIYRIYKFFNPTQFGAGPLTGASFVNSSTDPGLLYSSAEYDTSATAVDLTGVTYPFNRLASGFFSDNNDVGNFEEKVKNQLVIESDIAGNSDMIVITLESLGSSTNCVGSVDWFEFE